MNCESSTFEEISREVSRLRMVASTALKNIDTLYEDIMGCHPKREYVWHIDENQASDASDIDADPFIKDFIQANVPLNHVTDPNVGHQHCQRCRRVILPYTRLYRPPYNVMYTNQCLRQAQCFSCGRLNNACLMTDMFPERLVPHTVKVTTDNDDKTKTAKQEKVSHLECPLKVTIPEPFQMTIREDKKKEMKELRRKQLKKNLEEAVEKELKTKIHSMPVPGHTYVPIYQKMMSSNEERKKKRKELAKQFMQESVKPFNFYKPKKIHFRRSDSLPHLAAEEEEEEKPVKFKARPLPKHILSNDVNERLKNSEIQRKLRIRQRAEELFQQSSLPFTSRSCLKRSASAINLKDKNKNCDTNTVKLHLPQKYNFSMSQEDCKRIMNSWNAKVSEFHTSCRASPNSSVRNLQKPKPVPVKSAHYDVPVRKTTASMLREEMVRSELSEKNGKKKNENLEQEKKKQDMKETLSNRLKLASLSPNSRRDLEEKLKEFRISKKNRELEYERELKEMRKRIEKSPLLIERQTNRGKKGDREVKESENTLSESSRRTGTQTVSKDDDTSDDQEDLPDSST